MQIHGTLHMRMSAYFMRVAGNIISPLYCQQNYSQNAPKGTTERPKFQNVPGGPCPQTPPPPPLPTLPLRGIPVFGGFAYANACNPPFQQPAYGPGVPSLPSPRRRPLLSLARAGVCACAYYREGSRCRS